MAHVQIVRHDDGWAYAVNGVFSEPFPTHAEALAAARMAAAVQRSSNTKTRTATGTLRRPPAAIGRRPKSKIRIERQAVGNATP